MICTFYAHQVGFDRICDCLKKTFPTGKLEQFSEGESNIVVLDINDKLLKIAYREKANPSFQFSEGDDSPLSKNLRGLYGFVFSLPTINETVKNLFLHKIQTLNCEFTLMEEKEDGVDLRPLIENLALEFDAVLFLQSESSISRAEGPHFLDKNLDLIIDREGNCEIMNLDIVIDAEYFDQTPHQAFTEIQALRKSENEALIEKHEIKVNKNLPCIQSDEATTIRSPKEIAQRVTILAVTNMVAFNHLSGQEAADYLKKHFLWNLVTPKERAFLANTTAASKNQETWRCEAIWTLLWAINKVDNLPFPNELCNLNLVLNENYPLGNKKDPNLYINSILTSKSKAAILDAADLYYRLDWAAVDARIRKETLTSINPGVVYERHYALNWLIGYKGQAWDDVSCDT